jgi:hypothetical protein
LEAYTPFYDPILYAKSIKSQLGEAPMNTLRKASSLIMMFAAFCFSLSALPAEAALPSGLQDVYTIFTTGIPPSNTGPDTPF